MPRGEVVGPVGSLSKANFPELQFDVVVGFVDGLLVLKFVMIS